MQRKTFVLSETRNQDRKELAMSIAAPESGIRPGRDCQESNDHSQSEAAPHPSQP